MTGHVHTWAACATHADDCWVCIACGTEDDELTDEEWHDRMAHPVWQEGCADCVARAEWIEANR